MSLSDVNAIELATRLVELRKAKKSTEACEQFIIDSTVMDIPSIIGSKTYKGKEKILKKWLKQDKDNLKILNEEPFRLVKPGVVTRKVTGELLVLKVTAQQTVTFNAAGKVTTYIVKKL